MTEIGGGEIIQRQMARYALAYLEGRVITEADGRVWVFDPDCTHQPGIAFRDKFCSRCGMQLAWVRYAAR